MASRQADVGNSAQPSYIAEKEKESQFPSSTSLDLVKHYGTKFKRLREVKLNNKQNSDTSQTNASSRPIMSTESIMRLAKALLLQLNSQNTNVLQNFAGSIGAQCGHPSEVSEDLELALLLQAAAEMVAKRQFVHARRLLSLCDRSAPKSGNPVQRIVYYFAEALNERIDCQWGINSSKNLEGQLRMTMDKELALISLQPAMMAAQQEHPFTLITQCALAETILENVASAKRLHLIDFSIDNGSHWTPMMQAFAARCECPLDLLKITAVGTCKQLMEETGKWLSSFAETINLPFSFKIVLSHLKDLKEDLFKLEVDEAVAIYSAFRLWTQLSRPNQLEALIGVIKNLKPSVMVVMELELSTTTPIFLERFNEALFYLSAMFDYLKACLDNQILCRKLLEEVYLREMIRNVVTVEGSERYQQHERVSFWRSLFERCGFVETDISHLTLLQANLLLSKSERLSSCSMVMDGKCLIMGWKGKPLESISAWKLACDETD